MRATVRVYVYVQHVLVRPMCVCVLHTYVHIYVCTYIVGCDGLLPVISMWAGPDMFEECVSLVKEHHLYQEALALLPKKEDQYKVRRC